MMNLSLYVLNWKYLQYIMPEQQKDVEDKRNPESEVKLVQA